MTHEDVMLIVGAINALTASVSSVGTILLFMLIFKDMSGSSAIKTLNDSIDDIRRIIARK